jgi:hypothetical protein
MWPPVAACGATFDVVVFGIVENPVEPVSGPSSKKD